MAGTGGEVVAAGKGGRLLESPFEEFLGLGEAFEVDEGVGLCVEQGGARSPKVGASCYVDAVVSKGKESHGCFLMSWKVHP